MAQEKTRARFVKWKNATSPFRGAFTCLLTRRGLVSEGRGAGAVGRFSFCIKGLDENGVARAFAEWVRGGHSLAFSGGKDARATPPRRAPREKKGGSSQNG